MPVTAYARRAAMGTFFEVFLAGDDEEHLAAVADAVLEEALRVERLLSRFDPASEVSRINRQAAQGPVLVDFEAWGLLRTCRDAYRQTGGYFDVTARPAPDRPDRAAPGAPLILDDERRTVSLARPDLAIDLGGLGKGYALDRARELLATFGVASALVHGGTSSVLAVGMHPSGRPWPVALRDPFAGAADEPAALGQLALTGRALSCSAAFSAGQHTSDVIDPLRQAPLTEQAACVVVAPTALEAEVLSTACLCMAKGRARRYTRKNVRAGAHVGWIDRSRGRPRLTWLTEAP
jgi:thiamine biosynthesis lipoprotein